MHRSQYFEALTLVLKAAFVGMALSASEAAADDAELIDRQLVEMSRKAAEFDPKELHALGSDGLRALLDTFLPESAEPVKIQEVREEEVRMLLSRLSHDEFRVRQDATEKLIATARACRDLVVKATQNEDPEVRFRAERILMAWAPKEAESTQRYLAAWWVYLEGIKDSDRLDMLARRTVAAFNLDLSNDERLNFLRLCVAGVAQGGDHPSCDLLRPLVKHPDAKIATLVVETVGGYKGDNRFFPQLLVDALGDGRDEVVLAAISKAPNCWDQSRKQEVRTALEKIFESRSEPLKFQACFPLMHDYHEPRAISYLLAQVESTDTGRRKRALSWLGDACNSGRPATAEILGKLVPLLESRSNQMRHDVAEALGTYAGEEVVKSLLPLLADPQPVVVEAAARGLKGQRDKAMVCRLLEEAAENGSNMTLRGRAREIAAELQKKNLETKTETKK